MTPKTIPTKNETPKARVMEPMVIWAGKKLLIAMVPRAPKIMPMAPPIPERMMASKRN